MSRILILSGEPGAGKTRLCERAVESLQRRGVDVSGVISRSEYEGDEKVRLYCRCVRSGEERYLAIKADREIPFEGPRTKCWAFDGEALAWGNECLRDATPATVLVVDELGPIEFGRKEGFLAAFDALAGGQFETALVVVRPGLVETAQKRWPGSEVLDLDAGETLDVDRLGAEAVA